MKKNKRFLNVAVAFGAFLFWGNIVSLLLPAEEYGSVIKTVDFATALFLLAVIATGCIELVRRRRKTAEEKNSTSGEN